MLQTLRNAFKTPELRKKLVYTLIIVVIFRLGSCLVAPFVDSSAMQKAIGMGNDFFSLLNAFSGGAFGKSTLFALSVSPYITAQIIVQLLTVAIPALERLSKEGEAGRRKLNRIIKYSSVAMAALQAFGYYTIIRASGGISSAYMSGFAGFFVAAVIITVLTAGATLVVWLGDQITENGLGNGVSMLLFAGIIAGFPEQAQILVVKFMEGGINYILVPFILLVFAASIVFIVFMTEAERRIPVQYAKRVVGRKMYGGQSSYIPIKVNMSGVMPIIFASSLLAMPSLIMSFFNPTPGGFWDALRNALSVNSWIYVILSLVLIIGFNYFYVALQFNPVEIANNIKNNNGAIPGIRPGRPTSAYIKKIIGRITLFGAVFLAIIAVFPILFNKLTGIPVALGGTTIIIVVGVALETMQQLESQLMMRHHKGFLE